MDGAHPENAIRYFAVIGAEAKANDADSADPLPVSVLQRYPLEDHSDCRFPPALASFCFPRGGAQLLSQEEEVSDALHGFVLTNEAGERVFGAALHIWCPHGSGCWMQKALAVVSTQPLWGAFRAFLCSLRASSCPERFIVNFVAEMPLPPPGFVVTVALPGFPELAIHRPAPNQLPLLDLPVKRMLQQLKPETVVSLVEALLVEQRIVLHSTCLSIVCAFCEILVGLIWPLRPAAVYVPLLPNALVDFCGAPLPFVLGIASEMVSRAEAICEPQTMFVNVDTSEVKVTQETSLSVTLGTAAMQGPRPAPPERPHKKLLRRIDLALRGLDFQAEEQKHRFPLPLSRPTTSTPKQRNSSFGLAGGSSPATRPRMMPGMSDATEAPEPPDLGRVPSGALGNSRRCNTDAAHSLDHILARQGDAAEFESDSLIRMAFLWFMTDLLVDHGRFANERFDGGFDQAGFLSRCSETERPFLKEVTSTQMWASWIGRRINRSKEDSTDVILFDEVIAQKLNRKTFMFNKTATPFLSLDFSARMQESGHYRVPEPPANACEEQLSYYSTGTDWQCDESRFYTPRPLPNLQAMLPAVSIPSRELEQRDAPLTKDPLNPQNTAPLIWYLQHCWLLTWAAYLPDRPDNTSLQWAKMDLCLAMLHRAGEDHQLEMPAPHDLALSLLAAACARCGALRVDLARRLFAWMKAKQLGVATHPQSTSVFFERFVQLCASDHGDPHGPQVQRVPKTGEAEVAHRNAQGKAFRSNQEADVLLLEDLASRPRVVLEVVDGAPAATLVFSGECTRCQGKLTLNEIFSQWLRPGAEETSAVQCPTCRHSGTVHLHINVASRSPVEIDLLHPKRLALALRGHLDARGGRGKDPLGPAWLSGLASAPTLWTNLVWYFRSHSFFTEHLLTALGPEKVQNLAVEKIVVTLEGRERRAASMDAPGTGEVVASFASVHSRNQSMGGTSICTAEVWDDVELDLPMESPQLAAATAISCASTLVQRRISRSSLGGDGFSDSRRRSKDMRPGELHQGSSLLLEVSRIEAMQMEREDFLSQLWRSEQRRRRQEASYAARAVLNQVYHQVVDHLEPFSDQGPSATMAAGVEAEELARIVAASAVAKSMVTAMCRMLPSPAVAAREASLPSRAVIEVPTERQWIQARPATILTESDLSASGSFPATPATPEAPLLAPARSGAVQFQKCVPAAWDEAEESFATDSGQGQSGTTVSGDDSPAEQKLPPPTEAEGKDGAGGTQAAEPVEPPLVPTVLIPAPEPVLEAPQAPQAPHVPVVRSRVDTSPVGSATPLVKLKTLEDFLQEADEELKVRQRSASGEAADGAASHVAASLCPGEAAQVDPTEQLDDLVEEEDHLEARDSDAKKPEASLEEVAEPEGPDELPVVKLRPPPLMVGCDGDVRPAGRESLPSLPLLSVPDTPLSLAVQVQPRRASSAPPERRKRGRRAKIVPMVISTGLATAPNSQIPSPNAVFPTPLLPRERPQVFRYSPPERGRDRRSKSLAK